MPAIAAVIALVFGIMQTVRFQHWPLIVLSLVAIICGGGLIVALPYTPGWNGGPDSPMVDYGMGVTFGIFILVNILIPAWWFTKGKLRYRSQAFAQK